jgi:hypothetical protein
MPTYIHNSKWTHYVECLTDSVSLTSNFANDANFKHVLVRACVFVCRCTFIPVRTCICEFQSIFHILTSIFANDANFKHVLVRMSCTFMPVSTCICMLVSECLSIFQILASNFADDANFKHVLVFMSLYALQICVHTYIHTCIFYTYTHLHTSTLSPNSSVSCNTYTTITQWFAYHTHACMHACMYICMYVCMHEVNL